MPSSRQQEDSKTEHNQKEHNQKEHSQIEEKKPKISEHVIAKLPPADKINTGKKQKQIDSDSAIAAAAATTPPSQPSDTEGMVQMGGGLPALPPRPPVPQRQATASSAFSNGKMTQRVPNVNQVTTPQLNIPAGSDLGAVGKIGAYQMAQIKPNNTSSASQIHANMFFWVYALLFVTIIIMKKQ